MGRRYNKKKTTVERSLDLSISSLREWGMLRPDSEPIVVTWTRRHIGHESPVLVDVRMGEESYVKFTYFTSDGEGNVIPHDSEADLLTTPCNLGGVRYWFACPWCGKRVGSVYIAPGDHIFKCRHCNNLTYRSRNRSILETFGHISRQVDKIKDEKIRRWTWRGRPTRKVRRLRALKRRMSVLSPIIMCVKPRPLAV